MEFFNRLGERAKELGEKAKEVGKRPTELVEVTKLRYEVSKLKKVMDNNIEAIGELVYRQFKNELGLEAEIEKLLQNTKSLEENIILTEQQIEKLLPKPLVCTKCNTELPDEAIYCHKCGLRVVSDQNNKQENESE
ncbi:zinc ribbon domain-containing protein [Peptococcaceae bacterium 1198_IL3148]